MKYFIFLFFFVTQLGVFAQPKDQPFAVVATNSMRLFIRNISNPIQVAVPGYYDKDIVITTNVGKIEHIENSVNYTLNTGLCSEKKLTLCVFLKKPKGKLFKIFEGDYKIKPFPKPQVILGQIIDNGFVSYKMLNNSHAIFTMPFGFDFTLCDLQHRAKEFKVKHNHKDGTITIFKAKGNLLTEEMKDTFKKAETGDVITIFDVIVEGPNGIENADDELILEVKKT
ncbi:MAG: GldM family protein [Bacteroidia bacterium]